MILSFKVISVILLYVHVILVSADTKVKDSSANEALLAACMSPRGVDEPANVRALLEQNADINTRDPTSGQTCLMAASLNGKINIVKYLFKMGADPNIGEQMSYTPQHGAGFQGRAEVMKFLATQGVDVNHFHEDGFAPIHRACWGANPIHAETFKALVELGVDPELQSKDGKRCRDMTSNEEILKILGKEKEL